MNYVKASVIGNNKNIYIPLLNDAKVGSITKLMGFRIPHIINSAHINEF